MEQTPALNNREIDLIDLFSAIGRSLKKIFLSIIKIVAFLFLFGIQKAHFLALFLIGGLALGFTISYFIRPYYSSNMEAITNGISSSDMIGYINNLHELCLDNNRQSLAKELNMPDSIARKIKDIQAYYIVDVNMDDIGDYVDYYNRVDLTDTTQRRLINRINVEVKVYYNNVFQKVQEGLIQYMTKNPYLIALNSIRINELNELINQTIYEIQKLDSLQNTDYFQNSTTKGKLNQPSQMMILAEKEPTMYYENKFELLEKKHKLQRELLLTKSSFTVINDFNNQVVPDNPLYRYLIRYASWSLIVGYGMVLIFTFKNQIQHFVSNQVTS